ncbi:MAG: ABC transporter permease subunit [Rhodobacteraceae bacterium]|nr:ABC transporter permease subunit [Paracoccaceae bacterium]
MLAPLAIPGIVAALALYLGWTRIGLYDTIPGVILVQVVVGLPFACIVVAAALSSFDRAQVRASRSLGASHLRTLFHVILPGIRGAVASGFVLALAAGWDESVITLFVTGRNVQVLPRKIWDSLRYDIDPIVAVVATIMFVTTLLGVIAYLFIAGRRGARSQSI